MVRSEDGGVSAVHESTHDHGGDMVRARAAFDSLRKNHPACLDAKTARDRWANFLWDPDLVESLAEGFEKAQEMVAAEPQTPSGASKPASVMQVNPFAARSIATTSLISWEPRPPALPRNQRRGAGMS